MPRKGLKKGSARPAQRQMQQTKPKPGRGANRRQQTMDVTISAPVAFNRSSGRRGAQVQRHTECERIDTIVGSVSFASVGNYPVQPGLASSFPWLSGVAQHFERYRLNKLIVRYKNLKGTGNDGNILMSFDPDTLDDGPSTAIQQTQSTVYVDGAPWRIFELHIPCDRVPRFIRAGNVPGADLKTYDAGRVWVSAEGTADTSNQGYLEFEYDVELLEKQSSSSSTSMNNSVSVWNLSATTGVLSASAVLDIDEAVETITDGPTNTDGTVTLTPAGWYLVTAEISVAASAVDSSATVELRVDGASTSIPTLAHIFDSDSLSLSKLIQSDGTTTVDCYYNDATATHTFYQDACRLIVTAI